MTMDGAEDAVVNGKYIPRAGALSARNLPCYGSNVLLTDHTIQFDQLCHLMYTAAMDQIHSRMPLNK